MYIISTQNLNGFFLISLSKKKKKGKKRIVLTRSLNLCSLRDGSRVAALCGRPIDAVGREERECRQQVGLCWTGGEARKGFLKERLDDAAEVRLERVTACLGRRRIL